MAQFVLNTDSPFRLGTLSSDPTSAENGTFYYNDSDNVIRLFTDSSWDALAGKSYVDSVSLDKAYVAGATITTTSEHGPVVIGGSEKLTVTAAGGLDVQGGDFFGTQGGLITNSVGGGLFLATTDGSLSGPVFIKAGDCDDSSGYSGVLYLAAGSLTAAAASGTIAPAVGISGGVAGPDCDGGDASVSAGVGGRNGGSLYLNAGFGTGGNGGNVVIDAGYGVAAYGEFQVKVSGESALTVKGSPSSDGIDKHVRLGRTAQQYIDYLYHHELSFSSGTTTINALTFAHTQFGSVEISYHMKDQDVGGTRVGVLLVTCDGTSVSIADTFTETDSLQVVWSAAVNGDNVEFTTTSTNAVKFNCLVKSYLKIDGPLLLASGSELIIPSDGELTIPAI